MGADLVHHRPQHIRKHNHSHARLWIVAHVRSVPAGRAAFPDDGVPVFGPNLPAIRHLRVRVLPGRRMESASAMARASGVSTKPKFAARKVSISLAVERKAPAPASVGM